MASKLRARVRDWFKRNRLWLTLLALVVLFLVAYLSQRIFISIKPGETGVQWSRFLGGTIVDRVYGEGLHVIVPWNIMYIYDVRFQEVAEIFPVLSKDGLRIDVETQVRFRPIAPRIGYLHKHVGPEYVRIVLLPEVAAYTRDVISGYRPDELYAEDRTVIQDLILQALKEQADVQHFEYAADQQEDKIESMSFLIHIEDVFIRDIRLPARVAQAIQKKLTQEQAMLEYDFILQKEEKEKERKQIEAEGIRMFQTTISEGISQRYLKWRGIDATLELAKSPNAKMVVIGAGEDGLPLILGPLDIGAPAPEPLRPD